MSLSRMRTKHCAAIVEVFPAAMHRLCGWHLEKNCVQRVKDTKFRKVFKKAIYANFEGFLKSTDSILELVHSLDRIVKDYRNKEVTAQFYSTYYSPVLNTGLDSIELFASKLYT
ncbi:hypothetical protein AHAS_Ahas10G0069200 [Arachis hypogaea]